VGGGQLEEPGGNRGYEGAAFQWYDRGDYQVVKTWLDKFKEKAT